MDPFLGATTTVTTANSSSPDPEKLRGGYYTPTELARWLCKWAIRKTTDRVLEPSCGDGVFLSAAIERLEAVGEVSQSSIASRIKGIEVNPEEAEKARRRVVHSLGEGAARSIHTGDFFGWFQDESAKGFDVAVGNPPFVRYRHFPEPYREIAFNIMTGQGLKANRHTNIWVPFVVAAAESLRDGGRLAFVLPAELLQVSYANQLRAYLVGKFSRIDIITCNQLLFNRAEQEVVIVLAEGARPITSNGDVCRVAMTEFDTVSEFVGRLPLSVLSVAQPKTVLHESEKWLKYLLTPTEIDLMRELRQSPNIASLATHATVDVGVVTGKNDFFVMDHQRLIEFGLSEYAIPLISRSRQLQGAFISGDDWENLVATGERVHLLHLARLNGSPLGESLRNYIKNGETEGVNEGYKCANRSPWFVVPYVWEPQGFLLRQIYDFPRIVLNRAEATCTDTIHRLKCNSEPAQVIPLTYTYLTGASAEIEGRSYGGGILAIQPTEAERLLVPAEVVPAMPIEECDELVRRGHLNELLRENSRLVLIDGIGISENDCVTLKGIWNRMKERRLRRGQSRSPNP